MMPPKKSTSPILKKTKYIQQKKILIQASRHPTPLSLKVSKKKPKLILSSFKISEDYIKNQIDGLVAKKSLARKRKVRHLTVTSELDHPITETVQAILSEPESTSVVSPFDHTQASSCDTSSPTLSAENVIDSPIPTNFFEDSSMPETDMEQESENSQIAATAILVDQNFNLSSIQLEEPKLHLDIHNLDLIKPMPIQITSDDIKTFNSEVNLLEVIQVPSKEIPNNKSFLKKCFRFFIKIFTEFAKPYPNHSQKF